MLREKPLLVIARRSNLISRWFSSAVARDIAAAYEASPVSFVPPVDPKWSPKDDSKIDEAYLLPPPNVTGKLHMGHALTVTIQDSTARFARLNGKTVRWIFGTDHAGIATQSVVEKQLFKTKGVRKDQLGREAFIQEVWNWATSHKGQIKEQLLLLNASLDYDREYFTLDPNLSEAVCEAFVRLYERGLLKRAQRMVNWCPHLRTALSDLEVEHHPLAGPTELELPSKERVLLGVADDFAYKINGSNEELVVRTTRLETMLGDVAVAVHPSDARYKHLVGKSLIHPFRNGATIPIVADEILVDPTAGTGAVKITPAHDPNDFASSQRKGLPLGSSLFTDDGKLNPKFCPPSYALKSRFETRNMLRHDLEKLGLYRGQVSNAMTLNRCSRSGDIVEPTLKWQWFLNGTALANRAQEHVREHNMTFFPPEQKNIWDMWLNSSQDWCISRQLWWGHRIPAYRVKGSTDESDWVAARNENEARVKLNLGPNDALEQDEDVLDTWFSSGLLPISVFGWPNVEPVQTQLAWMETGADILFFWVARMVMLCTELNGKLPFPHVHLHSMVRDKRGRKMSKSLGNVIDPLDVIRGVSLDTMLQNLNKGNLDPSEVKRATQDIKEQFGKSNGIARYGADSLRLALASYPATVPQILFDIDRVAQARLFCNKLWQATRFVLRACDDSKDVVSTSPTTNSLHVNWLKHRLAHTMRSCEAAYSRMDVERASGIVREFFWGDFCDTFIESTKFGIAPKEERAALREGLMACIIALSPVAPGITADLWQHLSTKPMSWSMIQRDFSDPESERRMSIALDVVRAVRVLKLRFGNLPDDFAIQTQDGVIHQDMLHIATKLSRAKTLNIDSASGGATSEKFLVEPLMDGLGLVSIRAKPSEMDTFREKAKAEVSRIVKRLAAIETSLESEKSRLTSPDFLARAPENVRIKTAEKVRALEAEKATLTLAKQSLE